MKSKFALHRKHKNLIWTPPSLTSQVLSFLEFSAGVFVVLLPTLFCGGMSLSIISQGVRSRLQDQQLLDEGQTTMARVTHCDMMETHRADYHSEFSYLYRVAGRDYTGRISLNGATCDAYPVWKTFPILYLPSNPVLARFGDPSSYSSDPFDVFDILDTFALFFPFLLTLLISLPAIGSIKSYLRMRRLEECTEFKRGVWLQGEMTSIERGLYGNDFMIRVHYQFMTPRNTIIRGQAEVERRDLGESDLPSVGSPIMIFYLNDQTHAVW